MNINPMKLMQLRAEWNNFTKRHPKLPKFFQAVSKNALQEGTVLEISVTPAEGEPYTSNIKLTKEDIQLLQEARELLEDNRM